MSDIFHVDLTQIEEGTFLPLLNTDLTSQPPPFLVEVPLTEGDFHADDEDIFESIRDASDNVAKGFHPNGTLSRSQWIRTSAQLMAAIHAGLRESHPLKDTFGYVQDMEPDEFQALRVFGKVVCALQHYLRDPTEPTDSQPQQTWHQCFRCLQICQTTVSEEQWQQQLTACHGSAEAEDWQAQLLTCNIHAEAARTSIINSANREFRNEVLKFIEATKTKALDQAILMVTSNNPPPFEADPRIVEYVEQRALTLKPAADKQATKKAKCYATTHLHQLKEEARTTCDAEMKTIYAENNARLEEARPEGEQALVNLRKELRAKREALKNDLEHKERVTRKTTRAAKRPDPISTTARRPRRSQSSTSVVSSSSIDGGPPEGPT